MVQIHIVSKSYRLQGNQRRIESSGLPEAKKMTGSTFHSWCMELIMRYSDAFGLQGYSCIDEDDRETAIKLVIGRLYGGKKEIKLKGKN